MASLTEQEKVWGKLRVGRWTECIHFHVHIYHCDSSYLSFISLQRCRRDTDAIVEGEGKVPGLLGCWPPLLEGGGSRYLLADGMFLPPSAGSAVSTAPGWPKIGECNEWVGKSEGAGWVLMSFCEDQVGIGKDH